MFLKPVIDLLTSDSIFKIIDWTGSQAKLVFYGYMHELEEKEIDISNFEILSIEHWPDHITFAVINHE